MTAESMDIIDCRLLSIVQGDYPVAEPYRAIADYLEAGEDDVLS